MRIVMGLVWIGLLFISSINSIELVRDAENPEVAELRKLRKSILCTQILMTGYFAVILYFITC